MDNTINGTNMAFRSVIVPLNSKKPLVNYMARLKNFNIKGIKTMPAKDTYLKLFEERKNGNSYTGVMFDKDANNNPILRFLGSCIESDKYLYQRLKKADISVLYEKDVPDDGYFHGPFEIID